MFVHTVFDEHYDADCHGDDGDDDVVAGVARDCDDDDYDEDEAADTSPDCNRP